MTGPFPKLLLSLVRRRSRVKAWAYAIWLLVYLLTGCYCVGGLEIPAARAWPFLIPVGLLIVHVVYPTLLGWLIFFVPTVLYLGAGVYYAVSNNIGPHPQWQGDMEGVVLGSVFIAAMFGVCAALYSARPRSSHEPSAT